MTSAPHSPTTAPADRTAAPRARVIHVASVDVSIRFLLLNQLRYLQAEGYATSAVCSPGPWVGEIGQRGVSVHTVPLTRRVTPANDLRALLSLVGYFRRERPDIVHTHTPKAGLLGQYAGKLAQVPHLVHTIHGLYFPGHMKPQLRPAFVLLERLTMPFADAVLSQNREDVGTAIRERICRPERISYLGNGIDLSYFESMAVPEPERERVRRELDLQPDQRVVGMVGRLVREKGYLEYFAAARLLRDRFPDTRFVVIGPMETEKRDALGPDTARAHGLGDEIRFLGMRHDMPALYSQLDVLVLPSHREGFPRAPMEAAAMGVPTVATDIRGCREVVVPEVTGLLVPPRDPQSLAAAIGQLLADPASMARMGQAARQHARNHFDERTVFARVAEAYRRLVAPVPGTSTGRGGSRA
jgi:glycosyltransferase involved in cell wall biosynthesis